MLFQSKTHEQYEEQLFEREIDFYPLEKYVSAKQPILHECLKGHKWQVRPDDILKGRGCPTCSKAGFKYKESATLYFVSFVFGEQTYYKLGITNKSLKDRYGPEWSKLNMRALWQLYFEKGAKAFQIEQELLCKHSDYLVDTGALRRGNTETLTCAIERPEL